MTMSPREDLLDEEKQANGKACTASPQVATMDNTAAAAAVNAVADICCTPTRRSVADQQQTQHAFAQNDDDKVVVDSPTATASYSSRGECEEGTCRSTNSTGNGAETSILDGFCVEYQHKQQHQLQHERTPQPLPARLGRVVDDDLDDDDDCNDSNDERNGKQTGLTLIQDLDLYLTSSSGGTGGRGHDGSKDDLMVKNKNPRRRTLRRRSTVSQPKEESTTNRAISSQLCRILEQLNRLAVMDSTEYQQRLLGNSLPDALDSTRTTALSESEKNALLQLSMSIHRLHSAAANLSNEVDSQTDDMLALQKKLDEAQNRNSMLEVAVQKLHERNLKLKARCEKDRKKCVILESKIEQTKQKLNEQGFQLMANQVQNHEHRLLLRNSLSFGGAGGRRERADSGYSEGPEKSLHPQQEEEARAEMVIPAVDTNSDVQSIESSVTLSTMTVSVSNSQQQQQQQQQQKPLICDSFVPTLCFSAQSNSVRQRAWSSESRKELNDLSFMEDDITMATTTASIASDSPKSPPTAPLMAEVNKNSSNKINGAPAVPSLHNPFAKLLGPRPIQPYTLRMIPPFEMQYVALEIASSGESIESGSNKSNNKAAEGQVSVVEDHGMVLIDGKNSKHESSRSSEFAFAVCGFNGFSEEFNCKPNLGARLLQINGSLVDPTWSVNDLHEALKCNGRTKLTFSNDEWTEEQNKVLQAAIARNSVSVQSILADHTHSPNEIAFPPPRERASSSDSVGKAIYGIGSLISNKFQGPEREVTLSQKVVNATSEKEKSDSSLMDDTSDRSQSHTIHTDPPFEKQTKPSLIGEQQMSQQQSGTYPQPGRQIAGGRGKEAADKIKSSLTGMGKLLLLID